MHKKPVVIGIAGGSGSGKTTVQRKIIERYEPNISVLDHDAYYYDLGHMSPEKRKEQNFDHPKMLETSLLVEHLDQLLALNPIEKPVYNYATHLRTEQTIRIFPKPVIIVEGILILAEQELCERMDIKIFVDTDSDIRLMRRIRRDITERERTIEMVLEQYEHTVRPMHLEFVEPSKRIADIIIPRGGQNRVAMEMLYSRIEALIS